MSVSNLISILDFKNMYIEKTNDKELKLENIRMFVLGREMKDELFLYSYDIVDEMAIQVMVKK